MFVKYNIFIEGIPGSGKTSLLNSLASNLTDYNVFREGDISPVELAWCTYMSDDQYNKVLLDMSEFKTEIETNTVAEHNYFITAYTKIHTEKYQFYQYMEKYEIYGGRSISEFKNIIWSRFKNFDSSGNLFECSFFQNIIEELMLFAMFDDKQIVEFYKELISLVDTSKFKLIRLIDADIENSIMKIKRERVNEKGEENWYPLMMNYLRNSPYGKMHNIITFDDMVNHFKRRIALENKVINLLPNECYLNIISKNYELADILSDFSN